MILQAEINIGLLGHVDHGKTSLTQALSGKWVDTYSEEVKRGISIRIGYVDIDVYKCTKCKQYISKEECDCGGKTKHVRKISILDAPGHETLMATAISASNILDGAMLVIAANEKCPQPQTKEHLMILQALDIKNLIVIQNKIDLVTREEAIKNHDEIKLFLKEFGVTDATIIPMSANHGVNISALLENIEKLIPTPKRDEKAQLRMYVTRSFDVNKPGSKIKSLKGGVVGGSVIQGTIKEGDEIEIHPGLSWTDSKDKIRIKPVKTKVTTLITGGKQVKKVGPGGLIAVCTEIDPALTKGDGLSGNLIGAPGKLPDTAKQIDIKYQLFDKTDYTNHKPRKGEILVINIGTTTTVGIVSDSKGDVVKVNLKRGICADLNSKVALSKRVGQRWRLAGHGNIIKSS